MKTGAFLTGLGLGMMAGASAAMMMPDRRCIRKKARRAAHELEHSILHAVDTLCK